MLLHVPDRVEVRMRVAAFSGTRLQVMDQWIGPGGLDVGIGGEAPGAYVERVRTEAARRQLVQTDDTVTVIAARCGFGTAETMRRNFVRRVGISPDQYRRTFA